MEEKNIFYTNYKIIVALRKSKISIILFLEKELYFFTVSHF